MSDIQDYIHKAQKAQQDYEQKHDVQLSLTNPPRDATVNEIDSDRRESTDGD